MINVNFQHCSNTDPKRFKDQAEFELSCVIEDEDPEMFVSEKSAEYVSTLINDQIKDVNDLKEIMSLFEQFKMKLHMDIVFNAFKKLSETDPQLQYDIITAILSMIQSKISCIKAEHARSINSCVMSEINAMVNNNNVMYTPDEEVSDFMNKLIPDGAEVVEAGTYEVGEEDEEEPSFSAEFVEEEPESNIHKIEEGE